jgi:hypothetical protein
MFPFGGSEDTIRPLGDDDQRVLLGLVHKYGLASLMCALTGLGESCKLMQAGRGCNSPVLSQL